MLREPYILMDEVYILYTNNIAYLLAAVCKWDIIKFGSEKPVSVSNY